MVNLSIITINKNNVLGLEKTFNSVRSQINKNFEYIVIDGGSLDKSIELIQKNESLFSYWISEDDSGIYNAMNKGINKASGKYCLFLNSGDYLASENISEIFIKNNFDSDVVYGNLLVIKDNKLEGKIIGKEKLSFMDLYLSNVIKHQSSFIKKEMLIKHGLYNENLKIVADWEFFLKTIGYGKANYKYLNLDVAYFDNNGISNNSDKLVKLERSRVLNEHIPELILEDYIYFSKLERYKTVLNNKFSLLLIRILNKIIR
jgi:glycosyltransferase involved in cell wall biosynthesis